jgi:hypothetical protein
MLSIFSDADRAFLRRPHIARAWFFDVDLPGGRWLLHSGAGRVTVAGREWFGLSDPFGRQFISISAVEDPRFGQAAKVDIVLAGINADFLRQVKDNARQMEGRSADVYWAAFDQETQEIWSGGLKMLFPGYLSAPAIQWLGAGVRTVPVTVESLWQSQNYPFGGKWNPADQRRRFPGDKGLDYVGVQVQEIIKA